MHVEYGVVSLEEMVRKHICFFRRGNDLGQDIIATDKMADKVKILSRMEVSRLWISPFKKEKESVYF